MLKNFIMMLCDKLARCEHLDNVGDIGTIEPFEQQLVSRRGAAYHTDQHVYCGLLVFSLFTGFSQIS